MKARGWRVEGDRGDQGMEPVRLDHRLWFPDPCEGLRRGPYAGLVAVGGDLSPERLVLAYRSGIFPWSVRPVTWWSPDPRGVIDLGGMRVGRTLRRVLRRAPYRVTRDQAFAEVIQACATVRRPGGWISRGLVEAYTRLHQLGWAHSVECWREGELVGGVYGVAVGGLFAGESMFHRADDASKVALVALEEHLRVRGFGLFDVQMVTPATEAMGAREMPRAEYLQRLAAVVDWRCRFEDPG